MEALHADAACDRETARSLLQQAVTLGQPDRLVRPLADLGPGTVGLLNSLDLDHEGLEYAGAILSALDVSNGEASASQADGVLAETLSQRELEILNLFAGNLSNKEIAEELYISTGTVKRHAHNIFGKLAVSGRRDAVAKARGLGILRTS